MRVTNDNARTFYENEAVQSGWSTRALERQIHTFYYERLLASQRETPTSGHRPNGHVRADVRR